MAQKKAERTRKKKALSVSRASPGKKTIAKQTPASSDKRKTKDQLIDELQKLNRKISRLEKTKDKLKQHEILLEESEDRFKKLYERAPLGYQSLDENACFKEVNEVWLKTLGYKKNDVIGKWFGDFLPDEYKDVFRKKFSKFQSEGSVSGVEFEMLRKDGSTIIVSFDGKIGKTTDGNFLQTHCILQEITKQKAAEEALKVSIEALKNTQKIGHIGSWHFDIKKNILVWSDEEYRIFGYTPQTFGATYEAFLEAVHPDDREMVNKTYTEAIANNTPYECVHRVLRPDGEVRIVLERSEDIVDENGETIHSIGMTLDITEQKRMEEELLKAQKLESLGVLAGGIAHDFNNLLAGIFSTVSMARQISDKESEVNKVLAVTEMVLERTKDLTNQLLTFSKGGAPIKAPLAVASFLEEYVRFSLSGSSLKPEFSIPKDIWPIEADLGQMNQVIQNLVSNASEAMPQGGTLKVSVSNTELGAGAHHSLPEGRYVAISVSDTGSGIPEEDISRIFDPFFSTKKKGSGLGLASVHSIITQHGGAIDVTSGAGKGSTFTVCLPASGMKVMAKETPVEEAIEHSDGRILLMDDEEVIRDSSGMMLRYLGFDVVTATDGREALKMYAEALKNEKPFNAVILDLTVKGGMGGERTIKKLVEIDPDVRAIVSSGYSNDPVMGDFRSYGFKGVIEKPYNIERMSRVLKEVLAPIP